MEQIVDYKNNKCLHILLSDTNRKLVEIGNYWVFSTAETISLTVTGHCLHETYTMAGSGLGMIYLD